MNVAVTRPGHANGPAADWAVDDAYLAEADEVANALDVSLATGLSQAAAAERLALAGLNRIESAPPTPAWRRFGAQFADPLIYLLLFGIVVSVIAWAVEGATGLPVEAIVIGAIVLANGILGFVQERHAENAVAALERMAAPTARVLRDGREQRIEADQVVPGDVLLLGEGDAVTADGRVFEASSLTVAEAALTGESESVLKSAATLARAAPLGDRENMVFSGTAVTRGNARAVVTATGAATEIGHIATLLEHTTEEKTPLQREVDLVGRWLAVAVVIITAIVIGAVLLTSDIASVDDVVAVLLLGVSLAVAAVPEGLPAILTVVLAVGVQRMARHNAIVKKLASVETLGSASVICSDKTGTLTKNEMTIERVVTHSGEVVVTGSGYAPEGEVLAGGAALAAGNLRSEVRAVLGGGGTASDARLEQVDGQWVVTGDPTEAAFLVAEQKLGTAQRRTARFARQSSIPFSSERKLMSTVVADKERDGRPTIMTKGAPGVVLERCNRERVGTSDEPLTDSRRAEIRASVDRLADAALRTLAVAYRPLDLDGDSGTATDAESLEHDLVFAGIVGMLDSPRAQALDAVREAHNAGVKVVMLTGDHVRTAARIASDLGILAPGSPAGEQALNADDLESLDDAALAQAARRVSVYARVSPAHKLRIVRALQANGQIVAMTGDGVNDAPALRAADIGVAMGIAGTDVAREAANMILVDDDFATIVSAIREGRAIFANIKKFLRYLLSSNLGEVITVFVGVVAAPLFGLDVAVGIAAPLLATQILWINLLTDSAPALALGFDPLSASAMRRPPRKLSDRVIDREMVTGVLFVGAVMAAVTLLTIDAYLPGGLIPGDSSLAMARTMGFSILVVAQLFNALNARTTTTSALRHPLASPRLLGAIALSLALQILVVHLPLLNQAFATVPLSLTDWAVCIAAASIVLWAEELRKLARRTLAGASPSLPNPA